MTIESASLTDRGASATKLQHCGEAQPIRLQLCTDFCAQCGLSPGLWADEAHAGTSISRHRGFATSPTIHATAGRLLWTNLLCAPSPGSWHDAEHGGAGLAAAYCRPPPLLPNDRQGEQALLCVCSLCAALGWPEMYPRVPVETCVTDIVGCRMHHSVGPILARPNRPTANCDLIAQVTSHQGTVHQPQDEVLGLRNSGPPAWLGVF
mmetsp:Transcript_22921/g.40990  ORF Transcript_22921/g.40990 Transcript_22921/m.40990 type:complete len:207 (+) Transcript_22921:70-690(+)